MENKILKFIKSLLVSPLEKDDLCKLETNKPAIDSCIQILNQHIDNDFSVDNVFVEPDEAFYRASVYQQAAIIKRKISLSSECCPISFQRGESIFGISTSVTNISERSHHPLFLKHLIISL